MKRLLAAWRRYDDWIESHTALWKLCLAFALMTLGLALLLWHP